MPLEKKITESSENETKYTIYIFNVLKGKRKICMTYKWPHTI